MWSHEKLLLANQYVLVLDHYNHLLINLLNRVSS